MVWSAEDVSRYICRICKKQNRDVLLEHKTWTLFKCSICLTCVFLCLASWFESEFRILSCHRCFFAYKSIRAQNDFAAVIYCGPKTQGFESCQSSTLTGTYCGLQPTKTFQQQLGEWMLLAACKALLISAELCCCGRLEWSLVVCLRWALALIHTPVWLKPSTNSKLKSKV